MIEKVLDLLDWLSRLDRLGGAGIFNRQGRPWSPAHLGSKGNSRNSGRAEKWQLMYEDDEDDLARELAKGERKKVGGRERKKKE
jgi:hypothetical protein